MYKRQELQSEHPLGKAVVRCYRKGETRELPQPEQFRMIPGRGVQAVLDGREPVSYTHLDVYKRQDGGRTWSDVKIAMDDSKIDTSLGATKGVGDPAILVDEKTGRIWVAAIWSHKHSIWGSKMCIRDSTSVMSTACTRMPR